MSGINQPLPSQLQQQLVPAILMAIVASLQQTPEQDQQQSELGRRAAEMLQQALQQIPPGGRGTEAVDPFSVTPVIPQVQGNLEDIGTIIARALESMQPLGRR